MNTCVCTRSKKKAGGAKLQADVKFGRGSKTCGNGVKIAQTRLNHVTCVTTLR